MGPLFVGGQAPLVGERLAAVPARRGRFVGGGVFVHRYRAGGDITVGRAETPLPDGRRHHRYGGAVYGRVTTQRLAIVYSTTTAAIG